MHYYVIEWENEEVDEPHRVYLELDRENRIRRKIEFYRVGLGYYYEDLCTDPVDIKELAGDADYGEVKANAFEIYVERSCASVYYPDFYPYVLSACRNYYYADNLIFSVSGYY